MLAHAKETDTVSLADNTSEKPAKYGPPNSGNNPFFTQLTTLPLTLTDINNIWQMPYNEKNKNLQEDTRQLLEGLYIGPNGFPLVPYLLMFYASIYCPSNGTFV